MVKQGVAGLSEAPRQRAPRARSLATGIGQGDRREPERGKDNQRDRGGFTKVSLVSSRFAEGDCKPFTGSNRHFRIALDGRPQRGRWPSQVDL